MRWSPVVLHSACPTWLPGTLSNREPGANLALRICHCLILATAVTASGTGRACILTAQTPRTSNADISQDPNALETLPVPTVAPRVIPLIDPSLTGWNEAGPGPGRSGISLRANWVMPDSSGSLSGTVLGETEFDVAGMNIFLLRDGFVVNEAPADERGNFKLEGLKTGLYTIVGYSPSAFFTYGFNSVNYRDSVRYLPRRITTRAVASFGNKMAVGKLIEKYSPEVRFPEYGKYDFGEADISQARHFGWRGLGQFDVPATPATSVQSRAIALDNGGTFRGRVHQVHHRTGRPVPVRQSKVLLIGSGQVIAETACDRFGIFEFSAVEPATYGLVAAGSDGFAAIGIRLFLPDSGSRSRRLSATIPGQGSAPGRSHSVVHVSQSDTQAVTPAFDLTLIQTDSIGWINHYVTEQQFAENASQPRPMAPQRCQFCYQMFYGPASPCGCGH